MAGFESTLLRIAVGARIGGAGWMGTLAVLALARLDPGARPVWIVVPTLAVAAWPFAALASLRRTPGTTPMWLTVLDGAVAGLALLGPTLAGTPDVLFYGGVPLIAVAVSAVGGAGRAWAVAAVLGAAVLVRAGVASIADVIGGVDQLVTYAAGALLFSWVVAAFRRSEVARREAESERVRAETRAEMSRHLHDSVLQTLAMIQREAERPEEVRTLARGQERDLRAWLFGAPAPPADGFSLALQEAAAAVEHRHRVTVEVVVVGDAPGGRAVEAVVGAATEAMTNAAVHGDGSVVSVYGEAGEGSVRVYVRDRGPGFDPAETRGRHGIAESIVARVEAVGGMAVLRTGPGRGTEWELEVST